MLTHLGLRMGETDMCAVLMKHLSWLWLEPSSHLFRKKLAGPAHGWSHRGNVMDRYSDHLCTDLVITYKDQRGSALFRSHHHCSEYTLGTPMYRIADIISSVMFGGPHTYAATPAADSLAVPCFRAGQSGLHGTANPSHT